MNKFEKRIKKIKLVLLFTLIVFIIMLVTMLLSSICLLLLFRIGILHAGGHSFLPFFVFILISLLLGSLIAAGFSRRPLHPFRVLADASDQIATGNYSVRIDLKGPEEFERLTQSFNHMAEELGSVEMLRSDFVNNFSHEFKTPIVSLRGFAKMLKREDLTAEERNEYLDIIIEESERLTSMATNALNLTKLEQQVILTDETRFNVSEQIRIAITMMDNKWKDKNVSFSFDSNEIYIIGNEETLKQVWLNLLDNAVKFSDPGGTVAMTLNQNRNTVTFCITNNGHTIPEKDVPKLFEKFYQGDSSRTTAGNGLGLAICKRIIELHGGSICLANNADSQTTFCVTLPQSNPAPHSHPTSHSAIL